MKIVFAVFAICMARSFFPVGAAGQEAEAPRPVVDKTKGSIEGVITFKGDVPKARVRDDAGELRDLLVVDRRTKGLQYVLFYLDIKQTAGGKDKGVKKPSKGKAKAGKLPTIDQSEHRFVPHLLVVGDGQRVKFTNSDAANHNVRAVSFVTKNDFNVFTGAGGSYEHVFLADRKIRPTRLSCDIHPWMGGWIYVFKHPHYAVSDKKGRFRIAAVPPGDFQLVARQPDVGYTFARKVSVKAGKTSRIEIAISEKDIKAH